MHFFPLRRRQPDVETPADPEIPPELHAFEIIEEVPPPPPKAPIRLLLGFRQRWNAVPKFTRWFVVVLLLVNLSNALLATRLAETTVYPGSKVTADIRRTNSSFKALQVFRWIFAIPAGLLSAAGWVFFVGSLFDRTRRIQRKGICYCLSLGAVLGFGYLLAPVIGFLILYMWVVIEGPWHAHVWSQACQGWDIMALLDSSTTAASTLPLVANATVSLVGGSYMMQLLQHTDNPSRFDFIVANKTVFNATFDLDNITYDIDNTAYAVADRTWSYQVRPNLSFPSLNLNLRDPSIPFNRSIDALPSADLILQTPNSTLPILQTITTNPNDDTELKVCGTNHPTFQIALGLILIKQYQYSITY